MTTMITPKQQKLIDSLKTKGYEITNPEDYKNINSVISIVCEKGHRQTDSIANFQRNDWECIECIKEEEKNIRSKKGYLLSLDAATVNTGWAIFNRFGQLLSSGVIEIDKKMPLMKRIKELLKEVDKMIDENSIKVVAIENVRLEYNTMVFKTLCELRGILFYHLDERVKIYSFGADIWRSFSHIKGSNRQEKKENTMLRAKIIYDKDFREDEADAIFLGKYTFAQMSVPEEEIEELMTFGGGSEIEKIG